MDVANSLDQISKQPGEMNWMIVIVMGFNFSCLNAMIICLDFCTLVVSWHMKAATMCEFSKQEFIGGLQGLGEDRLFGEVL
nr:hypothetical protein CFP56_77537 [Quercus suber]